MITKNVGVQMYTFLEKMFPYCRSITGDGVRKTLADIKMHIPALKIYEIETGVKCFDWEIPPEWNIKDAYIKNKFGEKIVDFNNSNLHVLNYSIPVNKTMNLTELDNHLHSLPDQPDALPYVTSYYEPRWGFAITHNERTKLKDGMYSVKIDSSLKPGSLTYGEILIPGEIEDEILISTYICHPSLANNELSGPVLATFLSKWILSQKSRKYSYRVVFVPETIGAIAYLSKNLDEMKKKVIAGYVLTCVGDDKNFSFMPSRKGNLLADKVALHILDKKIVNYKKYTFLERGSDERQYCAPGIDLPVCSVMRSKYG
jgi:aminopeptidase-like protein